MAESGSIVVEHKLHNPRVKVQVWPLLLARTETMAKSFYSRCQQWQHSGKTLSPDHHKINCSSPVGTFGTSRENAKKIPNLRENQQLRVRPLTTGSRVQVQQTLFHHQSKWQKVVAQWQNTCCIIPGSRVQVWPTAIGTDRNNGKIILQLMPTVVAQW